jgi:hypothetical protein
MDSLEQPDSFEDAQEEFATEDVLTEKENLTITVEDTSKVEISLSDMEADQQFNSVAFPSEHLRSDQIVRPAAETTALPSSSVIDVAVPGDVARDASAVDKVDEIHTVTVSTTDLISHERLVVCEPPDNSPSTIDLTTPMVTANSSESENLSACDKAAVCGSSQSSSECGGRGLPLSSIAEECYLGMPVRAQTVTAIATTVAGTGEMVSHVDEPSKCKKMDEKHHPGAKPLNVREPYRRPKRSSKDQITPDGARCEQVPSKASSPPTSTTTDTLPSSPFPFTLVRSMSSEPCLTEMERRKNHLNTGRGDTGSGYISL